MERLTLDPRTAIVATAVAIVGLVSLAPLDGARAAIAALLVVCAGLILAADPGRTFTRSLLAIPFAATVAAAAPLRLVGDWSAVAVRAAYVAGWWHAVSLVITAWLCTSLALTLASHLSTERLLAGLAALKVPSVLILLLTFIGRYMNVFGARITSMRRAIDARAPRLGRMEKAHLYGHLGGSLVLRTHDTGERIHQAMLARGFDGTLPSAPLPRLRAVDLAAPVFALAIVLALWAL